MKQIRHAEKRNTQNFPASLKTPAPEQARAFHRYCTPTFVTQFKALANKPEKQKLILDAIDRFQKWGADAEGCRQVHPENKLTFELDAGQGIRFRVALCPSECFGGALFRGAQPEKRSTNAFENKA